MFTPQTANSLYNERLLPPFLGELGYEIRFFLAYVEPHLRSGWKIISNRSALYPPNTTIEIPALFSKIDLLKEKYLAQPTHAKLAVDFNGMQPQTIRNEWKNSIEREIRELLIPYLDTPGRVITPLDRQLTSAWSGHDEHFILGYHGLKPSYKPAAFVHRCGAPKHIGVQFRKLPAKDPSRDSDIVWLYPRLQELALQVGLPLFVYGEPRGCAFPEGCLRADTFHPKGTSALAGDLACLKSCEVMFSPDSGWTDLMGWLQVPTILQSLSANFLFHSLIPFKPRIQLIDRNKPLVRQFNEAINLLEGTIELESIACEKSFLLAQLFDINSFLAS